MQLFRNADRNMVFRTTVYEYVTRPSRFYHLNS